jgi:hypothetical protein
MNDSTIQMIAQAIIANTKVIQSLIDALPHETKQAVAEVVAPAPVVKPVVESAPVVKPVVESAPVVAAPVVAPAPVMPAPPTFAPAAPAPVAAPSVAAPFTDGKGLIDYVMAAYRTMGPQKGAQIQNVLTGLGYQNINDIKPADYAALYAGVEALKVS